MIKKILNDKELKEELLKILEEFSSFCEQNNLRYSLDGGSLIGAIRHKGFIPWDDDIDVMMPRDDYDKFIKLYNDNENFHLISLDKNKFFFMPIAKLISNKTTGRENNYKKIKKYGVYLDIFPLDFVPMDSRLFYEKIFYNKKITDIAQITSSKYFFCWRNIVSKKDYLINLLLIPLSIIRSFIYRSIIGYRKLYSNTRNEYKKTTLNKSFFRECCSNGKVEMSKKIAFMYWCDYNYETAIDEESFNQYLIFPFEHLKCRIIKDYDIYLRSFYKTDYMQLPPKEDRINKHNCTFYWKRRK